MRPVSLRRRLLIERLAERRVLAAITGEVFEDINFSLRRESAEAALEGRVLYLDSNQNSTLDNGEAVALSDSAGQFTFPSLSEGTYLVRIFNGTTTQQQTFPIEATVFGPGFPVDGGNDAIMLGPSTAVSTDTSVYLGDTATGQSNQIRVADQLADVAGLPDGTLLAIGTESRVQGAWLIDPSTQAVRPTGFLSGTSPVTDGGAIWSQIEIDESGRGFMLGQTSSDALLRALDASDLSVGVQVTGSTTVPADTQLLSSSTGSRSVLAWAGNGGLELSLWSNGGTQIGTNRVPISGAAELLDFDDDSGLLAILRGDGDVSVHDVDGNFATLHTFSDVGNTVLIDGARELLLALSPADAVLQVVDLRDGSTLANLGVDLSSVGSVSSLTFGPTNDSLIVLGSAGVANLSLLKPGAHRVEVADGETSTLIRFGLNVRGDNTAPAYDVVPSFVIAEDTLLNALAPAAIASAGDAEGDRFILLQTGNASHGISAATYSGGLRYEPEQDYNGNDGVPVILHDGRTASSGSVIRISVQPVPDPPTVVSPEEPLPENAVPGTILGPLTVVDPDPTTIEHSIFIDDERFGVIDGQLIFIGGELNFEDEREILIKIGILDEEYFTEEVEQVITVTVGDVNEPITDITARFETTVDENVEGSFVSTFDIEDEDFNETHTLTVDDSRFVFRGFDLYLADGVAVDYEETPTIPVNVTATDIAGHSLTYEFIIQVIDEVEQAGTIELGGDSVVEFVPGDVVGPVLVDGVEVGNGYSVSVDDSRFEIVDSILKLADGQSVDLATQSEIELTISVQDTDAEFEPVSEVFVISVLANSTPFHNDDNPYDVNRSGHVTAADALAIINYLNAFGPGPVGSGNASYGYDVNSDEWVTALDALLVLNYLNLPGNGGTVGGEGGQGERGGSGGEGEQSPEGESPQHELQFDSVVEDSNEDASNKLPESPVMERRPTAKRPSSEMLIQRFGTATPPDAAISNDATGASNHYAEAVDDVLRLLSDRQA